MPSIKDNNDQFQVTARKWRPRLFSDVSSQVFITQTLLNAIKNNRISHAYLFTGPRGVGKTTIARLLAKSINCAKPGKNHEPCNECPSCIEINNENRNHPDVFEIDGASNRNIEDIRELKEKVKYGPLRSKYKVFIIDEVHMLTGASFNALLKTLEEPPPYVVFIFATTTPEKVPVTILGRCQRFDFKRLTIEEIISRLKYIAGQERIKIDEESLYYIAKKSDGSMRDAQGLFDMTSAYCNNKVTFENLKSFFNIAESDVFFRIAAMIKNKDSKGILQYLDELIKNGHSLETLLEGLTEHYRNMLTVLSTGSAELINEADTVKSKYNDIKPYFTELEILNCLKLILSTEYTFKYSFNQRTLFETLMIELIKYTEAKDINVIMDELKELKKNFEPLKAGNGNLPGQAESVQNAISSPEKENSSILSLIEEKAKIEDELISHAKNLTSSPAPSEIKDPVLVTEKSDIENWETLLHSIETDGRRWVYSLLKKSEFKKNDKTYEIMISDDQFDMLIDHKDYIKDRIDNYFADKKTLSIIKRSERIEGAEKESITSMSGKERIKQILIDDFKGKLIG